MGDTPLHLACWGNHAEVVKYLLEQPDINVNIKNGDGAIPKDVSKSDQVAALIITRMGISKSAANLYSGDSDED
jgi:ankyrin repeat protein